MYEMNYGGAIVEICIGNIVEQQVDAIVNAANSRLAGGGGVDGAIHTAGGQSIMLQTNKLYPNGCPTGLAVITEAGRLPARFVIHAVAPVYRNPVVSSPHLYSAYKNSLVLAEDNGCSSVAFPSLGTGAYRYPVDEAAQIAFRAVKDFLDQCSTAVPQAKKSLKLIRFVLFDKKTYDEFNKNINIVLTE